MPTAAQEAHLSAFDIGMPEARVSARRLAGVAAGAVHGGSGAQAPPWHFLYLAPEPQGHGSFRRVLLGFAAADAEISTAGHDASGATPRAKAGLNVVS